MKINIDDLEFKFKFRDDLEMPATMILIIGQFKVKGFTIRKSKFEENNKRFVLFTPSNRSANGKWIKIFWTDVKDDWKLLEKKVLEEFDKQHSEYLLNKDILNQIEM